MDKQHVIFFTGAGISVDSGIPTFQDQPNIRDRLTRDFANKYPEAYRNTIRQMVNNCKDTEPNIAHKAIAEAEFTVITMNIDGLHTKAGSKNVIEVHGVLPTPEVLEEKQFPITYSNLILYGDIAPKYNDAIKLVKSLEYNNSYFVIVGTSFYTGISSQLYAIAKQRKAKIEIINDNASKRVPIICKNLKQMKF